ncbi:hypothetical protein ACMD2_02411 [Ananas comosus]|uniref:DUF4378 domain-containing protein n=1 Tax=Ananas comosus TaxID=4615 RepID=A0A199UWB7_ANACO|nr:hypothetical protein ACMD2_02411 [Ananas comosus]
MGVEKAVSKEKEEKGKEMVDNVASSLPRLVDEDEIVGVSSVKGSSGSSDYSCSSSVTDEEGNGVRPLGVVARLMGLDSMPKRGVSEPYSTPLYDLHDSMSNLRENADRHIGHGIYINDRLSHVCVIKGTKAYPGKLMEMWSEKMPSSPIERFGMEALPLQSSKAIAIPHYKSLSPIRSPAFTSTRDAAHIMEVAAQRIEPRLQSSTNACKVRASGIYLSPLRVSDSRETITSAQRTSRLQEAQRRLVGSSSAGSLKGKPLKSRSLSDSEESTVDRPSSILRTDPSGSKGVRKSRTLEVQSRLNVQRREGSGNSSRKVLIRKDFDECKLNGPVRSEPNNQRNSNQKRTASKASSVLRQNNSKQNGAVNRDKSTSKSSVAKKQAEKALSGEAASRKVRAVNKPSASTTVGYRKDGSGPSNLEKERLISSDTNTSQTKKVAENISVSRIEKHIQHNVVIDERSRLSEDKRKNAIDVVSFTFTSPMNKSLSRSLFPSHEVGKYDIKNGYSTVTACQSSGLDSDNKNLLNSRSNVIDGDFLGILLEQKLRELTSRAESPYCKSSKGGLALDFPPALPEAATACETSGAAPVVHERESLGSCQDELVGNDETGILLASDEVCSMRHDVQQTARRDHSSNREDHKEPGNLHSNPHSIFEASFSNESCISSESWESSKERKISSSAQVCSSYFSNEVPEVETEIDLPESPISSFSATTLGMPASETGSTCRTDYWNAELEFVRQMLRANAISFDIILSYKLEQAGGILDPLLFEELEANGVSVDFGMRRKMLFGCINECLGVKLCYYFHAGYRLWAKGVAFLLTNLAEEVYREISAWDSMGEWMVDELVERDMSSQLGRWVDFETESFELGIEIESEILSSLVDEVVADFDIGAP